MQYSQSTNFYVHMLIEVGSGTDSGNNSPTIRAVDTKAPMFNLPQIPHVNDSPASSSPTTPNDDPQGHRRTDSVALNGEDYFMSALNFRHESKSMPGTPQGTVKRNATFSPRIIFHDTWPSGEYDRRGEIATCNRLTPMLAQQIKEELNTFKMVGWNIQISWVLANTLHRKWKSMRIPKSTHTSSNETTTLTTRICLAVICSLTSSTKEASIIGTFSQLMALSQRAFRGVGVGSYLSESASHGIISLQSIR